MKYSPGHYTAMPKATKFRPPKNRSLLVHTVDLSTAVKLT